MAQKIMYGAVNNSPKATLTAQISATDTVIPLSTVSGLLPAPNIVTIGVDDDAEVVRYNSITGNSLGGCERGFGGTTAKVWLANELVYRAYTKYDHDTFIDNINDLATDVDDLQSVKLDKTGSSANNTVGFTQATTRANIATGEKQSILFGKIAKWFSDLKALAFKNTIGTGDIDNAAVTHEKVAKNAVGTDNVVDSSLTKAKLDSSVRATLDKADSALQSVSFNNLNADVKKYLTWENATTIPNGADLNDYTTLGVYFASLDATASTITNLPSRFNPDSSWLAFKLDVRKHGSRIVQIYTEYVGKHFAIRTMGANNTFGMWHVYYPYDASKASATPLMDGTASVGNSNRFAMENHVHPKDTSKQDKITSATAGIVHANSSGTSVTPLSADDIPTGIVRKSKLATDAKPMAFTVTLPITGWTDPTDTVEEYTIDISNANFVVSGYSYIVKPAWADYTKFADLGVFAEDVTTAGKMKFHSSDVPTEALTVNVLRVPV